MPRLYSLSEKTIEGRELWVLQICTDNPAANGGQRSLLKPMVKYVANMHGNEVTGREILIALLRYLLETYKEGKPKQLRYRYLTTHLAKLINILRS